MKTYTPKNFRPNLHLLDNGHIGQVIADLYDSDTGKYYRTAIVADMGKDYVQQWRYCTEQNFNSRDINPYCDLPYIGQCCKAFTLGDKGVSLISVASKSHILFAVGKPLNQRLIKWKK